MPFSRKEQDLDRRVARALDADPPDFARAAAHIERAVTEPDAAADLDVPYWLGELAQQYASAGRYDNAILAMERAMAAGWHGRPDGRAHIAEFHLQAGRAEEAHALFAAVKADTPDDPWLYNLAGMAYAAADNHGRALQWLTEGLELVLQTGDPDRLAGQLAGLRLESLVELRLPPDELQGRADRFVVTRSVLRQAGFRNEEISRGLVPIRVGEYVDWCAKGGRDPGESSSRAAYAAELARQGGTGPWPPGRNEPCWCGSGRKYKRCCGAVTLPPEEGG